MTNPSVLNQNPIDRDFLSQLKFRLVIKRSPNFNFFCQKINIPGMIMPGIPVPNPLAQIWVPGNRIMYNELVATFKVDEDFANYLEIMDWLVALGHPDDLDEYGKLAANPKWTGLGLTSDITVLILDASLNANFEIHYPECQPFFISDLNFNSDDTDVKYLGCTVKFYYSGRFKLHKANSPITHLHTRTKVEL